MPIHRSVGVATALPDVSRTLRHDHPGQRAAPDSRDPACLTYALIALAQHLACTRRSDPDAPLFAALEAARAGDVVSNTVDHLEETILLIAPCLKVDPRALLRAVIVIAQQRLDWGYGPIGGAHAGAPPAGDDRPPGAPADDAADTESAAASAAALDAATVAVESEAESLAEMRPAIDKAYAVQLIVQHLRDNGWMI